MSTILTIIMALIFKHLPVTNTVQSVFNPLSHSDLPSYGGGGGVSTILSPWIWS